MACFWRYSFNVAPGDFIGAPLLNPAIPCIGQVLDTDLQAFYSETTKRFNQQLNRNGERLPNDVLFQLDDEEHASLRLQFAALTTGRGQLSEYLPYLFTEHGAIMAGSWQLRHR